MVETSPSNVGWSRSNSSCQEAKFPFFVVVAKKTKYKKQKQYCYKFNKVFKDPHFKKILKTFKMY